MKLLKDKSKVIQYMVSRGLLLVLLTFLLFPVYWMIATSFKENSVLFKMPPQWIPLNPIITNYVKLLSQNHFIVYYKNSFMVALGATLLTMLVALFAGYGFSRFKFKFKNSIMMLILSTQMFPVISLLISLYVMYKSYGLLNNRLGLVLAMTTASLPFSIWMLKSFFDGISISLEEAAGIDGCGRFGILFKIIFPLSKPGFLSVGIYTFLLAWDDFLYSLTLINKDELRTLPPGISIRYMGEFAYDWANVMTVCVTATIPILLLFLFLQRYMIAGLTSGAVKG